MLVKCGVVGAGLMSGMSGGFNPTWWLYVVVWLCGVLLCEVEMVCGVVVWCGWWIVVFGWCVGDG